MRDLARRCASEVVGTFALVFIGAGAVMVDSWTHGALGTMGIALAFAFVVTAVVAALGHVSGAHINPAVTIAFWAGRRFPGRRVIPYIVAQCTGSAIAVTIWFAILGDTGRMGATLPAIATPSALLVELVLSFLLMLVIAGSATDHRAPVTNAPLAIGLTVGFCALVGGPLTGASMNPARSFGPALIGARWQAQWIYWLAPIAGMIIGIRLYQYFRGADA